MLVSDVMGDVQNDIRQVLNTTTDSAIYIPWVNRVQHDVLHTSLFNYLLKAVETISVVSGTSLYTLGTPVRRIELVYDRSFDRIVQDMDDVSGSKQDATAAVPTVAGSMLSAETMTQWPLYYRRVGNTSLYLFPAPQKAVFNGTYEVHYEGYVTDIANTTDTLTVPNDARDIMVAGVNSYALMYLKLYDESAKWNATYEAMKNGIALK
jgi:hypothetical protein